MSGLGVVKIQHPRKIVTEIFKRKGSVVVIAIAIAASIPGNCFKVRRKSAQLRGPIAFVASDTVQQNGERALARLVNRDGGSSRNFKRLGQECCVEASLFLSA